MINRYVLHGNDKGLFAFVSDHHQKHHLYSNEARYLLMPFSIIAGLSIFLFVITWLIAGIHGFPLLAGFIAGYISFILIHYATHYIPIDPHKFFSFLWRNHVLHHAKYPDKSFSVTLPLWDYVFKTQVPNEKFITIDPKVLSDRRKVYVLNEVKDNSTDEAFLAVPHVIYAGNPYWICPLESEVKAVFDPSINEYYKCGDARRWVLTDSYGVLIGRIAAFINFDKMYDGDKKIGGIGFFECINDKEAAFRLFDTAYQWLRDNYQVQAIDGPINFGENDKFWGLLLEGFTYPSYGMNYNPPYYKNLFEAYGYQIQYKQFTNLLDLQKPLPERFDKIAGRIAANPRYSFRHFDYNNKEIFIKDFICIYNQAWASFKNFRPVTEEYLRQSLSEIKQVMEETFIWFVYVDGEPAGLVMGMPDVNELLKYVNGKLTIWNKIKFIFYKFLKGFTRARVVIMGVIPKYQRLGLESSLILKAFNAGKMIKGYKSVQLAWVGDFNDKMMAVHNAMEAQPDTTHATYRKIY